MIIVLPSPAFLIDRCPRATRRSADDNVCLAWDAHLSQVGLDELANLATFVHLAGYRLAVNSRDRATGVAKANRESTDTREEIEHQQPHAAGERRRKVMKQVMLQRVGFNHTEIEFE